MRLHYIGDDEHTRRQLLGHLKGNAPDICAIDDYAVGKKVQKSYSWHLRRLIDAWIDTGRTGELWEDPGVRNLYKGPLYRILERWAADSPAEIEIDRIKCESIVYFPDQYLLAKPRPFFLAYRAAVRRFVVFLNGGDKFLLCRCRHCEKYYYLLRMARGPLEYGTYCSAHRQIASAERSNKEKADPIRARRLKAAATASAKLPKRLQTWRQKAEWIRDEINKHPLIGEDPVQLTWVTRNRVDIEKGLSRGKTKDRVHL